MGERQSRSAGSRERVVRDMTARLLSQCAICGDKHSLYAAFAANDDPTPEVCSGCLQAEEFDEAAYIKERNRA